LVCIDKGKLKMLNKKNLVVKGLLSITFLVACSFASVAFASGTFIAPRPPKKPKSDDKKAELVVVVEDFNQVR